MWVYVTLHESLHTHDTTLHPTWSHADISMESFLFSFLCCVIIKGCGMFFCFVFFDYVCHLHWNLPRFLDSDKKRPKKRSHGHKRKEKEKSKKHKSKERGKKRPKKKGWSNFALHGVLNLFFCLPFPFAPPDPSKYFYSTQRADFD